MNAHINDTTHTHIHIPTHACSHSWRQVLSSASVRRLSRHSTADVADPDLVAGLLDDGADTDTDDRKGGGGSGSCSSSRAGAAM